MLVLIHRAVRLLLSWSSASAGERGLGCPYILLQRRLEAQDQVSAVGFAVAIVPTPEDLTFFSGIMKIN